jgi:hypothetical protein
MAKAEGYAGNQLSVFPEETSNCPSSVPVHARSFGIPAGVCSKVFAS